MSLINDMLKDLDREPPGDEQPLPAGLVERKIDKPSSVRRYLLPGVALTAVAYALIIEWNVLGIMPEKSSAPAEIPQPIALNSKWLKHDSSDTASTAIGIEKPVTVSSPPVPADRPEELAVKHAPGATIQETSPGVEHAIVEPNTAAEQIAVAEQITIAAPARDAEEPKTGQPFKGEPIATDGEPLAEGEAVQRLLTAAAYALAANRLTTPAGDNAYQLYKSVLVVDPTNPAAHAGVESIRQRYLDWLDKALRAKRRAAAQTYWQKAKSVGADATLLASYQNALEASANSPETTSPAPRVESATASSEPAITPADSPNDEHMAARLRNEGLRGERDALRLLAQTSSALQTAVALTDLYVERRAVTDLRRLADSLNHQSARPYVMAQLFVLNGQDQQALDTLAAVEFSGGAERQRLRLLAGLRQKAGQYAAAMEIYAALVAVSPDNVGDWLGLAVSADKGKLAGTALNAYEKVLLLRHPDQRVMQYARQRQQDLSLAAVNNR